MMPDAEHKHRLRLLAYLAGFFLSLSVAIGAYINSSFVEQFVGEQALGLVFSLAAIVSLIVSPQALRLVRRFGNQRSMLSLGIATIIALTGTVWFSSSPFAAWLVATYIILSFLTAINLDVYLEELSENRVTGRIRGLFLTINNMAWLASPWLAGWLTTNYGYRAVYFLASIALLPFIFIVQRYLKDLIAREVEHLSVWSGLRRVFAREEHDLRRILTIDFLLNFFGAVMVIYMPIYLHQHLGLSWGQIGLAFTVMLIPFVVLEFPLGRIADLWLGEKELLTIGLAIAGVASLFIAPITATTTVVWAGILLLTRVGSATIEAMKETYLFKHISGRDANIVFISRNMYPLAYVLAPIIASVFLLFWPLNHLFTFLGLVMLLGLPVSLSLKDTR